MILSLVKLWRSGGHHITGLHWSDTCHSVRGTKRVGREDTMYTGKPTTRETHRKCLMRTQLFIMISHI